VSFLCLKLSDRAMSPTTKFGGLSVATIAAQSMPNGIKGFFGI